MARRPQSQHVSVPEVNGHLATAITEDALATTAVSVERSLTLPTRVTAHRVQADPADPDPEAEASGALSKTGPFSATLVALGQLQVLGQTRTEVQLQVR